MKWFKAISILYLLYLIAMVKFSLESFNKEAYGLFDLFNQNQEIITITK